MSLLHHYYKISKLYVITSLLSISNHYYIIITKMLYIPNKKIIVRCRGRLVVKVMTWQYAGGCSNLQWSECFCWRVVFFYYVISICYYVIITILLRISNLVCCYYILLQNIKTLCYYIIIEH